MCAREACIFDFSQDSSHTSHLTREDVEKPAASADEMKSPDGSDDG